MIQRITSTDDPRLDDYLRMTDVRLRSRIEPERGLFMAESYNVIERALEAGCAPRSFLMSETWLERFSPLFSAHPEVPVFVGEESLLQELTGFHLHRGALAAMQRPVLPGVEDVLRGAQREGRARIAILEDLVDHTNVCGPKLAHPEPAAEPRRRSRIAVLEGLVDHTNVGSAFRNAAALGLDAVLVSPTCADPLYRRSVRVSMGTVFQVPWTRIPDWTKGIAELKAAGYVLAGMTLGEGAITLDELVAEDHEKLALVFGTEGHGITRETDALLDRRVTIPMMGGVDSLNVTAAAAVAFYATR
ncbi:TrmH family RNA methyltransferase [Brachybacterium sp. AOP25-B2-12]|uniref:TrmH family RNA methyltransferase n=1 Tax=Brachybacterium sp. AOP25-B2-12 TaxID=3457710 RepID=UPI004033AFF9